MAYTTPPTFVAGDVLTADQLNTLGDDIVDLHASTEALGFTGTKVTRTASTSIADSTWSTVTFTAEVFDFGSWWSSGGNITVPASAIPAGYTTIFVECVGRAAFAANGTGIRSFRINLNGTPEVAPTTPGVSGDTVVWNHTEFLEVAAGDIITMSVYQNSGGSLNASLMSMTVVRFAPGN